MSELDDKLFEILVGGSGDMAMDIRQLAYKRTQPQIDAIKQAFTDAGYIKEIDVSMPAYTNYERPVMMTGQDWYRRFIKEVDHEPVSWPDNASNEYIVAVVGDVYDKAARRAANINEQEIN